MSDSGRFTMSVLGACWCRPILGRIKEVLKESKQHRKIRERARNKGKAAPETEENPRREKKLQSGKIVVEKLEIGQAPTWRNIWIKDQLRLSQGESKHT
jgi:hypothetical protein